jgi:hypothetical protein
MAVRHDAESYARRAANNPAGQKLMRFGFVARGALYCLIGVLALMMAFGNGGETTDKRGAIQSIAEQPFGEVLLWLVCIGLFGHAVWRFYEVIADPERTGSDFKAKAKRAMYFGIGIAYVSLGIYALRILMGDPAQDNNQSVQWTARLMSVPFGIWLVGLTGFAFIGAGIKQFFKGHSEKFRRNLRLERMSRQAREWVMRSGRWGYYARGVVWAMIGVGLITAATNADPQQARGLEGALDSLASQAYGSILLGLVAIGLVMYGIFSFVQARYRSLTS